MNKKRILVLGASGGIGQWVTHLALERGHQVRVVIRASTQFTPPEGVEVIRGDVLDPNVLEEAVKDQDVVISALGMMRVNKNNPWSRLASPKNFTTRVTKNLVEAMQRHAVKRLVAVSAAGVAESESTLSLVMKLLVKLSNVRKTFADFAHMEAILAQSGLDTLTVRPVGLVDNNEQRQTEIVDRFPLSYQVSKKAVAEWMLNAVERSAPFEQPAEMIAWT